MYPLQKSGSALRMSCRKQLSRLHFSGVIVVVGEDTVDELDNELRIPLAVEVV